MKKPLRINFIWLCTVILVSIIFSTIYTITQQSLRLNANDPQIQIAEDTASQIEEGKQPSDVITGKVDISKSLSPFVIVYDKSGNIISGNGYLNGQIAGAPFGILENANNTKYHYVTWQPQNDTRIATVEVNTPNYYILSGRSLSEIEKRENLIFQLCLMGWGASLVVILIAYISTYLAQKKHIKLNQTHHIEHQLPI